jgi:hypothetical protein
MKRDYGILPDNHWIGGGKIDIRYCREQRD